MHFTDKRLYDYFVTTYPSDTGTFGADARYAKYKPVAAGLNGLDHALPTTATDITAITVAATGDVFTKTAHGLLEGQAVTISAKTGGTGIVLNKVYFIHRIDANTFKLSGHIYGDDYLDVTADGSAITLKCTKTLFNTLALALPDPMPTYLTLADLAKALA